MKILALETSAKSASAAVVEDGAILAESAVNTGLTHSQTLMPMLCGMLDAARLNLSDMGLIAVSRGPGSFTGIRIGIGAAKGLAQGLSIPCFGVSTLEGLAFLYRGLRGLVCPVMDARCGQVYTALFSAENGGIARLREDEALSIEALCEILAACGAPVTLVGDGSCLVYQTLKEKLPALLLAPPQLRLQRAACVGLAAEAALSAGEKPLPPEELLPSYLRLPQAERELQKKLAGQNN
ncbi:MAG TPA: tRNA (adenosine(37)-N6)-threonylcarbamoyltransferase complex dimerization subunit type 1 TsaB [Candidatus Merdivicinus faecavium]|nr:tRNA (adenosine(37)-N6)-threonylcarbamoyltransferase complex dimerization subunit type 1 TsaB [Candidatus Merdivicinus faecavium]